MVEARDVANYCTLIKIGPMLKQTNKKNCLMSFSINLVYFKIYIFLNLNLNIKIKFKYIYFKI